MLNGDTSGPDSEACLRFFDTRSRFPGLCRAPSLPGVIIPERSRTDRQPSLLPQKSSQ